MTHNHNTHHFQYLSRRVYTHHSLRSHTLPKKIDQIFRGSAWQNQSTQEVNITINQNQQSALYKKEIVKKKFNEKVVTIPSQKYRWKQMEESRLYQQILGRIPFKSDVGELLIHQKLSSNKRQIGQLQLISSCSKLKSSKNSNLNNTKHVKIMATNKVSFQAILNCFQQEKKLQKWYSSHKRALKIF